MRTQAHIYEISLISRNHFLAFVNIDHFILWANDSNIIVLVRKSFDLSSHLVFILLVLASIHVHFVSNSWSSLQKANPKDIGYQQSTAVYCICILTPCTFQHVYTSRGYAPFKRYFVLSSFNNAHFAM